MTARSYKEDSLVNLAEYDSSLPNLINEISAYAHGDFSIYLRGSYANLNRAHTPWDMDIYFIVPEGYESPNFPVINTAELDKKFANLPELDLTIFSKEDLFHSPQCLLQRLLLIHGSRLAGGTSILNEIPCPVLNQETADGVKKIMFGFISKKFPEMLNSISNSNTDRVFLMQKVSKMLIRTGVFLGISQQKVFSREINHCRSSLLHAHPDLQSEIDYIFHALSGQDIDETRYLTSAKKIRDRVYHDS